LRLRPCRGATGVPPEVFTALAVVAIEEPGEEPAVSL
jgi:hypothetical protein